METVKRAQHGGRQVQARAGSIENGQAGVQVVVQIKEAVGQGAGVGWGWGGVWARGVLLHCSAPPHLHAKGVRMRREVREARGRYYY